MIQLQISLPKDLARRLLERSIGAGFASSEDYVRAMIFADDINTAPQMSSAPIETPVQQDSQPPKTGGPLMALDDLEGELQRLLDAHSP